MSFSQFVAETDASLTSEETFSRQSFSMASSLVLNFSSEMPISQPRATKIEASIELNWAIDIPSRRAKSKFRLMRSISDSILNAKPNATQSNLVKVKGAWVRHWVRGYTQVIKYDLSSLRS